MIERFTCQLQAENETTRMGYALAIGSFPYFVLSENLNIIIPALIKCARIESQPKWAESRRDAIKALSRVCDTIGVEGSLKELKEHVDIIFNAMLHCLSEYTIDNRGDIGAWVREAGMTGLHNLILLLVTTDYVTPEKVSRVMVGLAQQAVEKIDRTRALAGKLFSNLVHKIPHVPHYEEVSKIFPVGCSQSIPWLFAQYTFPNFCQLLKFHTYSESVMQGLIISIGDITETLMKHSSAALFSFLKSLHDTPSDLEKLGHVICRIFMLNQDIDRVTHPMLVFLDLLLSSGSMSPILNKENSILPEQIFTSTKTEIKGSHKMYKILASINVFCQLIQFDSVRKRALSQLGILLGHTWKHVRKTTATKFYEAVIVYSDCLDADSENLDQVLILLSESDWDGSEASVASVRLLRNEVCTLLNVSLPIAAPIKSDTTQ